VPLIALAIFIVLAFIALIPFTTRWIPGTLTYTSAGLAAGIVLGILGLVLTRWEVAAGRLYYTPNRWLVLAITLVVTCRLAYGFWRSWNAWQASVDSMTWVAASGVAASMSAGAIVLGYYLVYWFGVRRRLRRASRPLKSAA
jgi:hypothetical protein